MAPPSQRIRRMQRTLFAAGTVRVGPWSAAFGICLAVRAFVAPPAKADLPELDPCSQRSSVVRTTLVGDGGRVSFVVSVKPHDGPVTLTVDVEPSAAVTLPLSYLRVRVDGEFVEQRSLDSILHSGASRGTLRVDLDELGVGTHRVDVFASLRASTDLCFERLRQHTWLRLQMVSFIDAAFSGAKVDQCAAHMPAPNAKECASVPFRYVLDAPQVGRQFREYAKPVACVSTEVLAVSSRGGPRPTWQGEGGGVAQAPLLTRLSDVGYPKGWTAVGVGSHHVQWVWDRHPDYAFSRAPETHLRLRSHLSSFLLNRSKVHLLINGVSVGIWNVPGRRGTTELRARLPESLWREPTWHVELRLHIVQDRDGDCRRPGHAWITLDRDTVMTMYP